MAKKNSKSSINNKELNDHVMGKPSMVEPSFARSGSMYTYILKDIERGIYKIGKTTEPHSRFKSLCKRGKVVPIALLQRDVEKELHLKYSENRIEHPDYSGNGGTEWFRMGGRFDKFIARVDKGLTIPYISAHGLVEELIEAGTIIVGDTNTEWEIKQNDFSFYLIGVEILKMSGYIQQAGNYFINKDNLHIHVIGKKISVSEHLIEHLKKTYRFYLTYSKYTTIVKDFYNKKLFDSRARKVSLQHDDFGSEILLIRNKVL
jgi:hypothetical protein